MSLQQQIDEWVAADPERAKLTPREVVKLLREDGIDGNSETLKRAFRKARRTLHTESDRSKADTVDMVEDEELYRFVIKGKRIELSFEAAEDLAAHYVHGPGGSLTQAELARRMYSEWGVAVTMVEMRAMLSLLGIRKNSTPFAPHTLQDLADEDEERIVDAWRVTTEATVERAILQHRDREYRALYRKERSMRMDLERMVDEAVAHVADRPIVLPPRPVSPPKPITSQATTWVVVLSDWHVGVNSAYVERCVDELIYRWRMRRSWDARPVRSLIIAAAGDLMDGPGAGLGVEMHSGQGALQDLHGYDQVEKAAELLAKAVSGIHGACPGAALNVVCVPGNHDRGQSNRDGESDYLLGQIMYGWAQKWCGIGEWSRGARDKMAEIRIGQGRMLLTHGCTIRPKKDGSVRDMLFPHMDRTALWDLVVTGHLHEAMMHIDAHQTHVRGGAFKHGDVDDHAKSVGYNGGPSQVLIEVDPAVGPVAVHVERFER